MKSMFMMLMAGAVLAAGETSVIGKDAKVVQYGQRDIVSLRCKLRFSTVIALPPSERIVDFVIGDKEFWKVNGAANFAYVKPADAGSSTSLNLVTASGNVYSFLLTEGSDPDLKIFIELKDDDMKGALGKTRFYTEQDVDVFKKRAETAEAMSVKKSMQAKEEAEVSRLAAQAEAEKTVAEYPQKMQFPYRIALNKAPFFVLAMWHDDKFTYIKSDAREAFAVYEKKDGKPNLVHFGLAKAGEYRIDKVMSDGYLRIGKEEQEFFAAR